MSSSFSSYNYKVLNSHIAVIHNQSVPGYLDRINGRGNLDVGYGDSHLVSVNIQFGTKYTVKHVGTGGCNTNQFSPYCSTRCCNRTSIAGISNHSKARQAISNYRRSSSRISRNITIKYIQDISAGSNTGEDTYAINDSRGSIIIESLYGSGST
ncbi:hypothetical protein [Dehalococcoides mccartyi]|uniref:hypothetical protein n=1 Tax=Dehalococcoides mccartyi TaxID=61435 RepID=UPI00350E42B7